MSHVGTSCSQILSILFLCREEESADKLLDVFIFYARGYTQNIIFWCQLLATRIVPPAFSTFIWFPPLLLSLPLFNHFFLYGSHINWISTYNFLHAACRDGALTYSYGLSTSMYLLKIKYKPFSPISTCSSGLSILLRTQYSFILRLLVETFKFAWEHCCTGTMENLACSSITGT